MNMITNIKPIVIHLFLWFFFVEPLLYRAAMHVCISSVSLCVLNEMSLHTLKEVRLNNVYTRISEVFIADGNLTQCVEKSRR